MIHTVAEYYRQKKIFGSTTENHGGVPCLESSIRRLPTGNSINGGALSSRMVEPTMNSPKYYDIVGSLPLELVVQVAEYLHEADIVRNQRVRTRTISVHISRFRDDIDF